MTLDSHVIEEEEAMLECPNALDFQSWMEYAKQAEPAFYARVQERCERVIEEHREALELLAAYDQGDDQPSKGEAMDDAGKMLDPHAREVSKLHRLVLDQIETGTRFEMIDEKTGTKRRAIVYKAGHPNFETTGWRVVFEADEQALPDSFESDMDAIGAMMRVVFGELRITTELPTGMEDAPS